MLLDSRIPLAARATLVIVFQLPAFFRLRQRSLLRGLLVSLVAMAVSLRLAGFPYIEDLHGSHWQIPLIPFVLWGMTDTFRCLGRRWSLYHAGVLIMLYAELMILATVVFLALFL
jgi:hypothetical protein